MILANGQAYTIQGNFALPTQEVCKLERARFLLQIPAALPALLVVQDNLGHVTRTCYRFAFRYLLPGAPAPSQDDHGQRGSALGGVEFNKVPCGAGHSRLVTSGPCVCYLLAHSLSLLLPLLLGGSCGGRAEREEGFRQWAQLAPGYKILINAITDGSTTVAQERQADRVLELRVASGRRVKWGAA